MNLFKNIINFLLPPVPVVNEDKCAECGEHKSIEYLNADRVCGKCTTLNSILKASNRENRCCGDCGDPFISRNGEGKCFHCRGVMKTVQPAPMLDRIRDRELLEREMYNGQG